MSSRRVTHEDDRSAWIANYNADRKEVTGAAAALDPPTDALIDAIVDLDLWLVTKWNQTIANTTAPVSLQEAGAAVSEMEQRYGADIVRITSLRDALLRQTTELEASARGNIRAQIAERAAFIGRKYDQLTGNWRGEFERARTHVQRQIATPGEVSASPRRRTIELAGKIGQDGSSIIGGRVHAPHQWVYFDD